MLYERLGISSENVDPEYFLKKVGMYENPKREDLVPHYKYNLAYVYHHASLGYYLRDDLPHARKCANQCLLATQEYFFGTWRSKCKTDDDKIDPKWWKQHTDWFETFSAAIMWGGVLGKWEKLSRIAEYPDDDVCIDEKDTGALYRAISNHLRGGAASETARELEVAIAGSIKRARLLAHVHQAILDEDEERLNSSLKEFLKYYKQREFPKYDHVSVKVTTDGTFFVHLAEREGMKPKIDDKFLDHIVRFDL